MPSEICEHIQKESLLVLAQSVRVCNCSRKGVQYEVWRFVLTVACLQVPVLDKERTSDLADGSVLVVSMRWVCYRAWGCCAVLHNQHN